MTLVPAVGDLVRHVELGICVLDAEGQDPGLGAGATASPHGGGQGGRGHGCSLSGPGAKTQDERGIPQNLVLLRGGVQLDCLPPRADRRLQLELGRKQLLLLRPRRWTRCNSNCHSLLESSSSSWSFWDSCLLGNWLGVGNLSCISLEDDRK